MKMLKRRIAIFLCMLMAITTVTAYLPAAQETAEAKSWTYELGGSYNGFSTEHTKLSQFSEFFVVEEGNNELYLRNAICGWRYTDGYNNYEYFNGSELSGVKYVSKNKDILTVNEKTGKINAKKTGTALVKITWKKQTLYGAIKVISSSDMKTFKTANKTVISYAKKILKACGSKLTTAGALKAQKLRLQMWKESSGDFVISQSVPTPNDNGGYDYYDGSMVYSMDAFNAQVKLQEVDSYLGKRDPFTTTGKYRFKISSLSGSGKTVTATLSKAVTKDQMAGAQYDSWELSKISGSSYSFDIYLRDTKTNKFITATATIKTGSKKMTIKCKKSLKKDRKYEVMKWDYSDYGITDWSGSDANDLRNDWIHNGKYTFTAK
jgi:hypothetical protein